jgi:hypothetical protein
MRAADENVRVEAVRGDDGGGAVRCLSSHTPRCDRAPIDATPSLSPKLREEARGLEKRLEEITRALRGDAVMRARQEATPESIAERVQSAELALEIPKLRRLIETDIRGLEKQLDAAGAPPTPGRVPDWKK